MSRPDPRHDRLQTMGIDIWTPRFPVPNGPTSCLSMTDPTEALSESVQSLVLDWDELEQCVRDCTRCTLHETRTQTVFGVGSRQAKWMFIGEAPGEQEDLRGEPFVGRAGQLLDEMIKALGLSREEVYIANVLKCRPPKNRDPSQEESAGCESHLLSQVALVKPSIIIAVGRIAAQNLLKTATP
ncbi:MAG: uracil-DNA glycosylase, partial [Methylococcaceae bacterium]|nr:uracil-DNA glycosylase [Methylococcaceae bacterium]